MALEKRWSSVSPRPLASNGTSEGSLTLVDSRNFFVKQLVILTSGAAPSLPLQVKRVEGNTVFVGLPAADLKNRVDVSAYLVSDGSALSALEQPRPVISNEDVVRAVFEEEPAVALRTLGVDQYGNPYNSENPVPVAGQSDLINKPYDRIEMDYDPVTQDMTQARYFNGADLVTTVDVEYDEFSNMTEVQVTES